MAKEWIIPDADLGCDGAYFDYQELVRCKDCKYTDGGKPIADGRHWCELHGSFMYYCSDAERRTDDN